MKKWSIGSALAVVLLIASTSAHAITLAPVNLVDLIHDADPIVVGTVSSVTDGIGAYGLPYTEVTVTVEEKIRGTVSDTYTFRQIGLQNPRLTDDGTKAIPAAPQGIPRYAQGQHVLLFMDVPASMT